MVANSPKFISVDDPCLAPVGPRQTGQFVDYAAKDLNPNMSFLEMLDVVNDQITEKGEEPIAFAHDCRRGHLRHVLPHDRRQAARPALGRRVLPDLHAQLQGRRCHHRRAVPRPAIPGQSRT